MLATNPCYGLDWSVKDWIIYTGADRFLWKVKPNGDSLTQVTNTGTFNNNAKWNKEGNRFLYSMVPDQSGSILLIADDNGNTLDTLENFRPGGWNWKDNILTGTWGGAPESSSVGVYDIPSGSFHNVDNIPLAGTSDSIVQNTISFLQKNAILWHNLKMIAYTDMTTLQRTVIETGADNRRYWDMSLSPDSKTIIMARENRKLINKCTLEIQKDLYLMDVNGKNERRVVIPE